jgi:hypothetical protein
MPAPGATYFVCMLEFSETLVLFGCGFAAVRSGNLLALRFWQQQSAGKSGDHPSPHVKEKIFFQDNRD